MSKQYVVFIDERELLGQAGEQQKLERDARELLDKPLRTADASIRRLPYDTESVLQEMFRQLRKQNKQASRGV